MNLCIRMYYRRYTKVTIPSHFVHSFLMNSDQKYEFIEPVSRGEIQCIHRFRINCFGRSKNLQATAFHIKGVQTPYQFCIQPRPIARGFSHVRNETLDHPFVPLPPLALYQLADRIKVNWHFKGGTIFSAPHSRRHLQKSDVHGRGRETGKG